MYEINILNCHVFNYSVNVNFSNWDDDVLIQELHLMQELSNTDMCCCSSLEELILKYEDALRYEICCRFSHYVIEKNGGDSLVSDSGF